jgi:LysM repeat protein
MQGWTKAIFLMLGCAPLWAQSPGARAFYAAANDSGRTMDYQVQPGETLFHIAERFLGSPYRAEALAKENGISDPLRLKAGTHLRVPAPQAAIRYSILRLAADGEPEEYGPDDAMRSGDRFLLRVMSNTRGYLYLFDCSNSGPVTRIFPAEKRPAAIEAFSEYMLPAKGYFQLDRMRDDEEIWVVLASEPVSDLDAALDSGVLDSGRLRELTSSNSEKGIIIRSDDSDDEIVPGSGNGRLLVVHRIKIRRR